MNGEVPSRVLAAERRREFRDLMARGSLGCPLVPGCGHLLSEHDVDDWDEAWAPEGVSCRLCACGVVPRGASADTTGGAA